MALFIHLLHWNTADLEDDGDDDDGLEDILAFLPLVHLVLECFTAEVEVTLITEPQLVRHVWVLFEPLCQFDAALHADYCQVMANSQPVGTQLQVPLDLPLGVPVNT